MSLGRLLERAQELGLVQAKVSEGDRWAELVLRVRALVESQLVAPQLAFLDDPATWGLAFCSRQCGKGYTVARLMVLTAMARRGAVVVYVHQTYAEARNIMWADPVDGIPAVLRELGVPADCNESRLEAELPNGSVIRLMGADRGAWDKLRGQKLDLIVCDETQKAEDEGLKNALEKVVPDCLAARKGRFRAIGTPDEFCVGRFHDLCVQMPRPWAVHHWTAEDLKDRTGVWSEQLRYKEEHGISDDDPTWLREKRGLWVRDDQTLILPLTEAGLWDGNYPLTVPSIGGHPVPRRLPIEHYAGLDFGFTDSAALVVGSISREEGVLREVHSWKQPGLDTEQLAAVVRAMVDRYSIRRIFADSADPKTILDFERKYRLPVVAAQKHNKTFWIQDMKARLRGGLYQVMRGSLLYDELKVLAPDPMYLKKKRIETAPGSDDHCYDAGRYLYRGVFSEFVRAPEDPMTPDERESLLAAQRKEQALDRRNGPQVKRWTIG